LGVCFVWLVLGLSHVFAWLLFDWFWSNVNLLKWLLFSCGIGVGINFLLVLWLGSWLVVIDGWRGLTAHVHIVHAVLLL
jgi:hypothetical protein